jgi:hypothetical protein
MYNPEKLVILGTYDTRQRYEDLQSKIKYQNKATYLHNIHEVVHERDQQVYG